MEKWLFSLCAVALETTGILYFSDTFLERNTRGKQTRYLFFIFYMGLYLLSLAGGGNSMLKAVLLLIGLTLLTLRFYKASPKQSLFFAALSYGLLLLTDYIVFIVQVLFSGEKAEAGSLRYRLLTLCAKLLYFLLLFYIRKTKGRERGREALAGAQWLQLGSIPCFTMAALLFMYFSMPGDRAVQSVYLFLAVGLVGMNCVVICLMQNIREKEERIRTEMLAGQSQQNQLEAYRDMEKSYQRQRKKMHDYKNQLGVIQTLLRGQDARSALLFAEKLTESISVDMSDINTNHPIVNAVLNQKYHSMQEKNISLLLKTGDLHELSVEEEDIVILLANLLDNAIRAAGEAADKGGKAVIRLKLVYEEGRMILCVRNPVAEKVEIAGDGVRKKPGERQGIGLLNVKSVVEKYGGDMALSCDDKEFQAVVML